MNRGNRGRGRPSGGMTVGGGGGRQGAPDGRAPRADRAAPRVPRQESHVAEVLRARPRCPPSVPAPCPARVLPAAGNSGARPSAPATGHVDAVVLRSDADSAVTYSSEWDDLRFYFLSEATGGERIMLRACVRACRPHL